MAKQKPHGQGKTRTREHVIADLAVNYVERQVLLCGHTVERFVHDYGLDLEMWTYNALGEVENGRIRIQVKATDHLQLLQDGKALAFSLDAADLKLWLGEADPVMLVVYDGQKDRAYWLYIQEYFEVTQRIDLSAVSGEVTVRIPVSNRLRQRAIHQFAKYRDHVAAQIKGKVQHHA